MDTKKDYLKEFHTYVKVNNFKEGCAKDITSESFFGFPLETIVEAEKKLASKETPSVAYFSMEYGLATSFYNCFESKRAVSENNNLAHQDIFSNMRIRDYYFGFEVNQRIMDLPIYSGGLGVLAGDTLKSAADLKIPLAAIGILWRKGYFKQNFWFKDGQVPEELNWDPHTYPGLTPLDTIVEIKLKNQSLYLRLWKYYIYSFDKKHAIPLILLDADVEKNDPNSKRLTDQLYRSDNSYIKIMQRVILGVGGIKALEALGYSIDKYHLNEGHAAMALVEKACSIGEDKSEFIKKNFVYTCHTPVAAGHDRFPVKELERILPNENLDFVKKNGLEDNAIINFTTLLMNCCNHINAVSKKHGEIMRQQFPRYGNKIRSVTNGVHIPTWISKDIEELLKKNGVDLKNLRDDRKILADIENLRKNRRFRLELWNSHQANKISLKKIFENWNLKEDVFTLCWARRIAAYKRPSLIFKNPQRLAEIAKNSGGIQLIIAGKAHPNDNLVGTFINEIMNSIDSLSAQNAVLRIIMLENYDIFFGKILTNSVDVWLNNPLPPFEASGTSGMKAILNGVVQLSTLDGWVVEGAAEANIGEIFGYRHKPGDPIGSELDLRLDSDSDELYKSLEKLTKLYYETNKDGKVNIGSQWIDIMINCIKESVFFSTCRMVKEYRDEMWFSKEG